MMSSFGRVPSKPQTHYEPNHREQLCQNADGRFPKGGFYVLDNVSSACPSCSSVMWLLRCSEWLLVFGYGVARTLWLPGFWYLGANVFLKF